MQSKSVEWPRGVKNHEFLIDTQKNQNNESCKMQNLSYLWSLEIFFSRNY